MPHGAIRIRMAGIQSCGGVPAVISTVCGNLPTPTLVFADGGYAGNKLEIALLDMDGPTLETVRWPEQAKGVAVISGRRVAARGV